jgi:adenosylcobinamide-GDP ribazoletransferase
MSVLESAARDLGDALGFFTRLPAPRPDEAGLDMNRIAWAAPIAGAVVGAVGAAALGLARLFELPPLMNAALAIAAVVAATGALHEDGLADVSDGFGGGSTRARKLEIMRDSRIGAYGALALALALLIRVGAVTSALSAGFLTAAAGLILSAAVSRAGALTPLALLDPARLDGAGAAAGRLGRRPFIWAWGVALVIAAALGLLATGVIHAAAGLVAGAAGAGAMTALARRQIGGQTGDVAGAAQQWAEIGAWCGLLIGAATP